MTIREEIDPYVLSPKGLIGIDDEATLDTLNGMLERVTDCDYITPYIALERVRKVLAQYFIFIPKYTIMDGDEGNAVFSVSQFGNKIGVDNDAEVTVKNADGKYLYFEYVRNEDGKFDIFAEVVDSDDLDELLNDYNSEEEEDEDDETDMVGSDQNQDNETNQEEHKGLTYVKEAIISTGPTSTVPRGPVFRGRSLVQNAVFNRDNQGNINSYVERVNRNTGDVTSSAQTVQKTRMPNAVQTYMSSVSAVSNPAQPNAVRDLKSRMDLITKRTQ